MQYRDFDTSSRPRVTRRVGENLDNGEAEWADEESDLDPSYDPEDSDASDDSDATGITLGSQDTESEASDDDDSGSDLAGFIVDDDCVEFYSSDDESD